MCNSLQIQFPVVGTQLPAASASTDVCSNAKVVPRFSLGKTFRQENMDTKQDIQAVPNTSVGKALHLDEQATPDSQDSNEKTIESLRKNDNLSGSKLPFLWKLHVLLDDVEATGNDHIVSWLEHGRSFKVYRPKSFMNQIVPHYFKQSKYKSFQRQLHLYEFTRMQYGPEAGSYSHPLFVRGQPNLCLSLSPIKIKGKARTKTTEARQANSNVSLGKVARQSSVTSAVLSKREQEEWVAKINRMLVKGSTLAEEMRQSPQPSIVSMNEPEPVASQDQQQCGCDDAMCEAACCVFGANFHLIPEQHDVNTCACCYESDTERDDELDLLLKEME